MKHKEFVRRWLGRSVDVDHAYWAQCVDLSKFYIEQVCGIKQWTYWGSALTGWYNDANTFPSDLWYRVPMDRDPSRTLPMQGDIVFRGPTQYNPYWHVAIVDQAWMWWVVVVEQNAWNGNWDWKWDNAIRKKDYLYENILWFYRNRLIYQEQIKIPLTKKLDGRLPLYTKVNSISRNDFDEVLVKWWLSHIQVEKIRKIQNLLEELNKEYGSLK